MEEGRKDDTGKARFDLVPPEALRALVGVYTYGAGKYTDRNWERGIMFGRVFAAIQRHLWAWWNREDEDPESKLCHLAHAAWGCFSLLAYTARGMREFDDRPGWNKSSVEHLPWACDTGKHRWRSTWTDIGFSWRCRDCGAEYASGTPGMPPAKTATAQSGDGCRCGTYQAVFPSHPDSVEQCNRPPVPEDVL